MGLLASGKGLISTELWSCVHGVHAKALGSHKDAAAVLIRAPALDMSGAFACKFRDVAFL